MYESFKEFINTDEGYVYVIPDKSKQFILKKTADDLAVMAAQLKIDNEVNMDELEDLLNTIKKVKKSLKKVKESAKADYILDEASKMGPISDEEHEQAANYAEQKFKSKGGEMVGIGVDKDKKQIHIEVRLDSGDVKELSVDYPKELK